MLGCLAESISTALASKRGTSGRQSWKKSEPAPQGPEATSSSRQPTSSSTSSQPSTATRTTGKQPTPASSTTKSGCSTQPSRPTDGRAHVLYTSIQDIPGRYNHTTVPWVPTHPPRQPPSGNDSVQGQHTDPIVQQNICSEPSGPPANPNSPSDSPRPQRHYQPLTSHQHSTGNQRPPQPPPRPRGAESVHMAHPHTPIHPYTPRCWRQLIC